jgi:hypothetical protein
LFSVEHFLSTTTVVKVSVKFDLVLVLPKTAKAVLPKRVFPKTRISENAFPKRHFHSQNVILLLKTRFCVEIFSVRNIQFSVVITFYSFMSTSTAKRRLKWQAHQLIVVVPVIVLGTWSQCLGHRHSAWVMDTVSSLDRYL